MLRAGLLNFSKGVLSERLWGRVDVAAYNAGLKRGENIIVLKQGAFSIRPGFRYVSDVLNDNERLFSFQFSNEQTYALAFGQETMQPLSGGGVVTEEDLLITGISNATEAVISAAYHAYAVGDDVFLTGIAGTLGDFLNNRIWKVTAVPGTDSFAINANTVGKGAFSSASGGITRTAAPPPPDPPPPTPPPYVPPDPPPVVGGGGGGGIGTGGGFCVTDDTAILLADGSTTPAKLLKPGMYVRTQHEVSLEWGEFMVSAVSFTDEPILSAIINGRTLRATPDHRFFLDGEWVRMKEIGAPAGRARVARISVADARTYVSDGVLSHNIKAGGAGEDYL